ncbi:hypothetical protein F5Y18DRAFT_427084 [Xylariaceae sp. FL1019]|nr:hypothetical protein F5Y18DRAFT_427084 [Xylariaceae sp. FL1019]
MRKYTKLTGDQRRYTAHIQVGEKLLLLINLQRSISYFIDGLECPDDDVRSEFQFIRTWYQSILFDDRHKFDPEVLDDLDLWDLEGYTLLPISRITKDTKLDEDRRIRREVKRRQKAEMDAARETAKESALKRSATVNTKTARADTVKQPLQIPSSPCDPSLQRLLNKLDFPVPTRRPNYAVVLTDIEHAEAKQITEPAYYHWVCGDPSFETAGEAKWLDEQNRTYPYYDNWRVLGLKLGRLSECAYLELFEEASEFCVALLRKVDKLKEDAKASIKERKSNKGERQTRKKMPHSPLRNVWSAE